MIVTPERQARGTRKQTPEGALKSAIRKYLKFTGWYVVNMWQGQMSFPGIADLYALRNGRALWLEIKTGKGRQSDAQKAFEPSIKQAGGEYYLVRSLDDIK